MNSTEHRYIATVRSSARDTPLAEFFESGAAVTLPSYIEDIYDYLEENKLHEFEITVTDSSESYTTVFESDEWCEVEAGFNFMLITPKPTDVVEKPEEVTEPSETFEVEPTSVPYTPLAFAKPANAYEVVISSVECDDYEAAKVFVNGIAVFSGNLWDFHAGCMGPKVAGEDLTELWEETGVDELMEALETSFKRKGLKVTIESMGSIAEDQFENLW